MYLASVGTCSSLCKSTPTLFANLKNTATGITLVYNQASGPDTLYMGFFSVKFMRSYLIISISLNLLLTLMIVAQLVLYRKKIRNTMGPSAETTGLYNSIITMLIESRALYVGSFLVFAVTRSLDGSGQLLAEVFKPILAETQVSANLTRETLERCSLIMVMNRPSLLSSPFFGLPTSPR